MNYMVLLITIIKAVITFEKTSWSHTSPDFWNTKSMCTNFLMLHIISLQLSYFPVNLYKLIINSFWLLCETEKVTLTYTLQPQEDHAKVRKLSQCKRSRGCPEFPGHSLSNDIPSTTCTASREQTQHRAGPY